MHELSVTQSVLDIVIKHAQQAGASRVLQINLVIGQMSGIVGDSVQYCFEILSKDTIAEGAELVFERRPAIYRCRQCETTFQPDGLDWACPVCNALAFQVVSGREFRIDSIEVDSRLTDGQNPIE